MFAQLETTLRHYESGKMSRRELVGALAAMMIAAKPSLQGAAIVGPATGLNHATLFVRDVARSQEFYQSLFGMPILTRQGVGVNLRAGAGFVGLYPVAARGTPRIDHICIAIDGFEATKVLPKLQSMKLDAAIVQRGDAEELYFDDPDGISVQIQDTKYRGGVGRLGDRDPG